MGGGVNSSSTRSDHAAKTEETVSRRRQNDSVKEVGTPPAVYFAPCCFCSCAEQSHKDGVRGTKSQRRCPRNKVTKTVSEEQSHKDSVRGTKSQRQCPRNKVTKTASEEHLLRNNQRKRLSNFLRMNVKIRYGK